VNVVDHITVSIKPDTTICAGDEFVLRPVTDAVQFEWTPRTGLEDPFAKMAVGRADKDTRYQLKANLGSCSASTAIDIRVANYPQVHLPADTTICFGSRVQIHAAMNASRFWWSNQGGLMNANSASPFAQPFNTSSYVITVNDTLGCPKAVSDTMVVKVLPRVIAFAGNDTSITANQPLQLKASGGAHYQWSPSDGLSNSRISNPVSNLNGAVENITYVVRVSTPEGCAAEDAIHVKVYKTMPEIFVPTAFTPNKDGMNDVLRPILVGIRRLDFFNVYNRWGKLVFSTTEPGNGWDGRTSGTLQENGNYVFVVQAVDFTGRILKRKGYFVLLK
jgi:gliding motility-associated-like protein